MKVRIMGDTPEAAVLAGVLAAEGQEVVFNPDAQGDLRLKALKRRREIRLNLPWGWLRTGNFQLSASPLLKAEELGVAAWRKSGTAAQQWAVGGRNKLLLALECGSEARAGEPVFVAGTLVFRGLSLLDALEWDPGTVEISFPDQEIVVETGGREDKSLLGELSRRLQAGRIAVREVEDLDPYRHSLHLRELLSLPVALCHSTLGNFLSYSEGRAVAASLLEEGLQLYDLKALPLARLSTLDPRDLLQRLRRRPGEFDKYRNPPDRAFGPALRSLLDGDARAAREPHERVVRMCSQTGIDPRWNWNLIQKTSRVIRTGFYRDPVELYEALR